MHAPRHARSLAELTDDEVALVAEAWQARAAAVPGGHLHAIVNEGADAGSSLAHSHSQLVWFADQPPAVTEEGEEAPCPLCRGPVDELLVAERDGVAASAAWAGRLPYELLIAPREHETNPWRSDRLAAALQLAADALRRLRSVEGPRPANLWLHHGGGRHWHAELVPRLNVLAGIELGAGVYINTVDPAEAAGRLRGAASG